VFERLLEEVGKRDRENWEMKMLIEKDHDYVRRMHKLGLISIG
jgi:hypothetical protein